MRPYSPDRRTALVLCGTGAHGAYHAGVLRALQEAGVKIDVIAGQGMGAAGAALAAIDGGAKLWEDGGIWRSPGVGRLYGTTRGVHVAVWLALTVVVLMLVPLVLLAFGVAVMPRLAVAILVATAAAVVSAGLVARAGAGGGRRSHGAWWWRLIGAPLDGRSARDRIANTIWQLIRGAVADPDPSGPTLGRRYAGVLSENLSQPGFHELMVIATDVDTKRDVVAALLRDPYRQAFMAPQPGRERKAEAVDLVGTGRDHAIDMVAAAMTPPLWCDLHLMTFTSDSFWRGETHRLCDRPGLISRLLAELDTAGVTPAIVVSASAAVAAPHRLTSAGLDIRGRIGEFLVAAEAAAMQQVLDASRAQFDALYLICPAHNPIGPFDFNGAYDEASDRRHTLLELMERAYADAYHQFIEPVVGASGEQLARPASAGQADEQGIVDNRDSPWRGQ